MAADQTPLPNQIQLAQGGQQGIAQARDLAQQRAANYKKIAEQAFNESVQGAMRTGGGKPVKRGYDNAIMDLV
jgi:hypothetical protein